MDLLVCRSSTRKEVFASSWPLRKDAAGEMVSRGDGSEKNCTLRESFNEIVWCFAWQRALYAMCVLFEPQPDWMKCERVPELRNRCSVAVVTDMRVRCCHVAVFSLDRMMYSNVCFSYCWPSGDFLFRLMSQQSNCFDYNCGFFWFFKSLQ